MVLIFVLGFTGLQAQHFLESQTLRLRRAVSNTNLAHADFDNDGLLDLLMFNSYADGSQQMQFIRNDSTGFLFLPDSMDVLSQPFSFYALRDYDADNDVDIMLFGDSSAVYVNEGEFIFHKYDVNLPAFSNARWFDFDNDGVEEIVGSFTDAGESVTGVFKQSADSTWWQQGDTIRLSLTALEILDADDNGYADLFVSGRHAADSLFTGFLINDKDFHFTPSQAKSWIGTGAAGDLNGDGVFDVVWIGTDSLSAPVQKVFLSGSGRYAVRDTTLAATAGSVFVSDLDADGLADISLTGTATAPDTVHVMQFANGYSESITITNLKSHQFLDFDRDGNLDRIQITKPDSIRITCYVNQAVANDGPEAPRKGIAAKVFDRYFLYWMPTLDDHTDSSSLTYDVMVFGDDVMQSAEFDLAHKRRLVTAHGNNLTNHFKLFDGLSSEPAGYAVQAIDNSYHARSGTNGVCAGTGSCPLLDSQVSRIEVCPKESVTLQATHESLWFSFKRGYMGTHTQLAYSTPVTDTLFYFDPTVFDCSALRAYIIKVNNVPVVELRQRYACENQMLQFVVESTWPAVTWRSQLSGYLGTNRSMAYTPMANDTVYARLSGAGCDVIRKTAIMISKPEISVDPDKVAVMNGNSVELQALGGLRYEWSPIDYLSDPQIANPVAEPLVTTRYTVTGYDSINCPAQASVTVTVEIAGFVPNLFTPNNDGKNDLLKIYGLREARSFRFIIYNREGKIVYSSQNVGDVLSTGWDGRHNGQQQPAGVYYWKVKGQHLSGEAVTLGGKTEGSIILVR